MAKRKATAKQLAALKKGRATLAKKRRKKKAAAKTKRKTNTRKVTRKTTRKKSARKVAPKKRTAKRTTKKRSTKRRKNPVSTLLNYFIFIKKSAKAKTKYYLQQNGSQWIWSTDKPEGISRATAEKLIGTVAKRKMASSPAGWRLYWDVKKKR